MSADEEHVTTDAELVAVQRLMRGRRVVGVDTADGIDTTVSMIAWPDGHYTVADVQRQPSGDAIRAAFAPAMATYREGMLAVTLAFRDHFTPAVRTASRRVRWLGFVMYRHARPDGRPRRSGHRHRGFPGRR